MFQQLSNPVFLLFVYHDRTFMHGDPCPRGDLSVGIE